MDGNRDISSGSFASTVSSEDATLASETTASSPRRMAQNTKTPRKAGPKRAFALYDEPDDDNPFLDEGKAFGDPVDPDETEEEDGVVVLHKLFGRKVARHGSTVIKSGKSITSSEAEALRLAERLRLPAPRVHAVEKNDHGDMAITMDYVEGAVLEDVWPNMTETQKRSIVRQLRGILYAMRAAPPPPIGPSPRSTNAASSPTRRGKPKISSCGGGAVRDAHHYFDYDGGPFTTEGDFNTFLLSTLLDDTPPAIARALASRLRTDHRVVFTHGDLTQSNIIVREGRIVALLDWEYAGWYPEYWEYVKFLNRFCRYKDWREYADDIFPVGYGDELVDYVALNHWQRP
ncbi:hypothetical protein MKZ38_010777 [Zalerion maritima]|uniref:Aminoglycoside phosphotransferase domain-containing protein n=1 Tax=Zalerion maritima TaxID=339359 RepID=A0AAD5RY21_9PEZI|nr:hypothetical protein MKZ38_010777 [Zalerion maritima]